VHSFFPIRSIIVLPQLMHLAFPTNAYASSPHLPDPPLHRGLCSSEAHSG
jgi:hypothetical protein